jgi:predicted secreted protein
MVGFLTKSLFPATWWDRFLILIAGCVFALCFYLLIHYQSEVRSPGSELRIGTIQSIQPIRRRHAGSLAWVEVEGLNEIFLRDIVYTPIGVRAEVKMKDGRTALLPADSLIQFDEITVNNLEISLQQHIEEKREQEKFHLIPMPKIQMNQSLSSLSPLEVELEELTAKLEALTHKRLALQPFIPLPLEDALNDLEEYSVKPISPLNGEKYNLQDSKWLTVKWSRVPVKGVVYNLEISQGVHFHKKVSYSSTKNSLRFQLPDPGVYYWRVSAKAGEKNIVSQINSFTLSLRGGIQEKSQGFAERLPTTVLTGFISEISRTKDFQNIVDISQVPVEQCIQANLKKGRYFCRIKPIVGTKIIKVYEFEVQ